MTEKLILFLARGLGSGLLKPAPGTWGSLTAVLLGGICYFLTKQGLPLWFILIAAGLGIFICDQGEKYLQKHDAPEIVWDEFVGMWIAMWQVPVWLWPVSFILFRFFDISKIGPIKTIQDLDGGLGIMADDVLAGIIGRLVLAVVIFFLF